MDENDYNVTCQWVEEGPSVLTTWCRYLRIRRSRNAYQLQWHKALNNAPAGSIQCTGVGKGGFRCVVPVCWGSVSGTSGEIIADIMPYRRARHEVVKTLVISDSASKQFATNSSNDP